MARFIASRLRGLLEAVRELLGEAQCAEGVASPQLFFKKLSTGLSTG